MSDEEQVDEPRGEDQEQEEGKEEGKAEGGQKKDGKRVPQIPGGGSINGMVDQINDLDGKW